MRYRSGEAPAVGDVVVTIKGVLFWAVEVRDSHVMTEAVDFLGQGRGVSETLPDRLTLRHRGSKLPKVNVYLCDEGRHATFTVERVFGITPYMIGCPDCGGTARSCMYQLKGMPSPLRLLAEHPGSWREWKRPGARECRKLGEANREHVSKGGLLLRYLTGQPPLEQLDEEIQR